MKHICIIILLFCSSNLLFAQGIGINNDNSNPDASAILDVKSTTQGMLVPRMTQAQRNLIASPATGLLVYQTDGTAGFYFYNGSAWTSLSSGTPTGAAGGDLTGTYPNPTLANSGVTANSYGSASQVPAITIDAKGRITLASNTSIAIAGSQITSGTVADARLSGNVTVQGNTFNGNSQLVQTTAGGALPAISGANVTNLNASNLASGTVATARLGTGTANNTTFLRGDGTWATPSGGGGGTLMLDAIKNATQTGTANSDVDVTFVGTPSAGTFDGTLYTTASAGLYLINVNLVSSGTTAPIGPYIVTSVGNFYGTGIANTQFAAPTTRGSVTAVVQLSAGQTIKCTFSCNSAASTLAGTNNCRMTIVKLN